MTDIHPVALFRLSVLGPLASRERLERGELKGLIRELAGRSYAIPGAKRTRVSEKTLESWYYAWRRGGIEALAPKPRLDKGGSKLSAQLQAACLQAKRDNPRRSLNSLLRLLQMAGLTAQGELSRSSLHRLLKRHGLSRVTGCPSAPVERRSFVAARAGDIWYGDVMHGPKVAVKGRMQKVYLASLMDDASRLIAHSAFCPGETALDIEGVLKQAVLKRGLPNKLVIDNGAAYRAASLQGICARLEIRLIYCRPYAPQGKGKLERWHRTVRDEFLSELDLARVCDLADLNARLWAWVETHYHRRAHSGLEGLTPLGRWQKDLVQVRPLGPFASRLDALFYHRHRRKVRKDATVSFEGRRFEVPYELAGHIVVLVVDPHGEQVLAVESEDGQRLGAATALDALANAHRKRRKPAAQPPSDRLRGLNAVELTYRQYTQALGDTPSTEEDSP